MTIRNSINELKLLIRSRFGLIWIETSDPNRLENLLESAAEQLGVHFFNWTSTHGLCRHGQEGGIYGTETIGAALQTIESLEAPAVYHLNGLWPFPEDPMVVQRLKDATKKLTGRNSALIVSGQAIAIPASLACIGAKFEIPAPSQGEYLQLVRGLIQQMKTHQAITVNLTEEEAFRLIKSFSGLSLMEAEKILTRVIVEDGRLDGSDLERVLKAKKDTISKDGLLEYFPLEDSQIEIADLKNLKNWLSKRKQIVTDPQKANSFGLVFPKGILLLGVQGCGKSLCAKAVSKEWGLPLLKFDPSNMYDKYVGESEKNFKRALKMAERMAPIILWIDEIEKAFAQSACADESGATSQRILGTFLGWMQERRAEIFLIATANNIDALPPEFLRKGRFDEIFFVDLPNLEARREIFEIHLRNRKRDPYAFDLNKLALESDGFSGAEIEQVVVSALYTAFTEEAEITEKILLDEIKLTHPLSETMAEKVAALREWAKDRTVRANS